MSEAEPAEGASRLARRSRRAWRFLGWPGLAAVALPFAVYLAIVATGYDGRPYLRADCRYYYSTAVSLLADGDLDLANQLPGTPRQHAGEVSLDQRGRIVPKHPIPLALAALPWIAAGGLPGALAFNLAQLALLLGLLFLLARRVASPWAAAAAVALTGLASFLPHYAWNFSPDVFATLLLAGALVAIPPRARLAATRPWRFVLAGLLAGLMVASKLPLLVAVPFVFAMAGFRGAGSRRALLWMAAGLALPCLGLAALDTHLFGAPWTTSYDRIATVVDGQLVPVSQREDFTQPFATGLRRQIFDRQHGLLPTSFVTLLSLLGLGRLFRRDRRAALLVAGVFIALLLFFATYRPWDQSHWGNRFLLPGVALAALALAPGLDMLSLSGLAARARAWRPREGLAGIDLVWLLLIVVQLVPLWTVTAFPSQDGPTHLENAALFLDLGRADRPWLGEYFRLNPHPDSTWGGHLALASLVALFPPLVAEKLFLSGYLVLFAVAARRACGALRPEGRAVALLALPFAPNYLYHMGFGSFCYSLPLLFLLLASWLRRGGRLDRRGFFVFAGLGILLWLAHPVTLVAAAVALAALGGGWALWSHEDSLAARLRRHVVVPLLALAPAGLLLAAFAARQQGERWSWLPWGLRWRSLLTLDALPSFDRRELWVSTALAAFLAVAVLVALAGKLRRRSWAPADGLLLASGACALLALVAPNTVAGGGWVTYRLVLLPFLLALPWLASLPLPPAGVRACRVAGAVAVLALLALVLPRERELDRELAEYRSVASLLPAGATVLPLSAKPWGEDEAGQPVSAKVRPFLHPAGALAAEREGAFVLLDNYQAGAGYFPLRYRPERDPFVHLAPGNGFLAIPPRVDIPAYVARTGGRVDFVYLWGFSPATAAPPARVNPETYQAILRQLGEGYDLVWESSPRGLGRLYRARP